MLTTTHITKITKAKWFIEILSICKNMMNV